MDLASEERSCPPSPVRVEILHAEGCAGRHGARLAVERLAAEEAIPVEISERLVATVPEARELRFPGSPTLRVDSLDVGDVVVPDAGAGERGSAPPVDYGLGWRRYSGPVGAGPVPPDDLLRAALRRAAADRATCRGQRGHWTEVFADSADRYGTEPSAPAVTAAARLRVEHAETLLELGAGQGRDTLFFAGEGLRVTALDFAETAVAAILAKAVAAGVADRIAATVHNVREPLPFPDSSFDACFAHMLLCMALTSAELEALAVEALRVLRPGGLVVYTVRTTADPDYGKGTRRGEDLFETSGFVVHFFSRELVERLARGFELVEVVEFEEGPLPRRLFRVTLRKPDTTM